MNDDDPGGSRLLLELVPDGTPPLAAVRRWIAATLPRGDRTFVADVQLVATELITNAYDHAGGATGIRVAYDRAAGQVIVEVDDASAEGPRRREARVRDVRGRGLLLVDSVTRIWGTRPVTGGGKTVWAVLQLAGPGGEHEAGRPGAERPASDVS